ncbi:hypothetical protein ACOME3_006308 [Neoechinorhynchus agilis]
MILHPAHDEHVITCLMFDGRYTVTASDDTLIRVFPRKRDPFALSGHQGGVWCAELQYPYIFSGSTDRSVKVWHIPTRRCISSLRGHVSTVRCLKTGIPWGKHWIVTGSRDQTIRVWQLILGTNQDNRYLVYTSAYCLHVLTGHIGAVRCLGMSSEYIVSGAYDNDVRIWKIDQDMVRTYSVLRGHTNRVYCLQFNGTMIVSGSMDATIRLWDVADGTCLHVLSGHDSLISHLLLIGRHLFSCNADKTVKLWNVETGTNIYTLDGPNAHTACVTSVAVNRAFVLTCADDGKLKLWDGKTGIFIRDLYQIQAQDAPGSMWSVLCTESRVICVGGSRGARDDSCIIDVDLSSDAKAYLENQGLVEDTKKRNVDMSFLPCPIQDEEKSLWMEDPLCWLIGPLAQNDPLFTL